MSNSSSTTSAIEWPPILVLLLAGVVPALLAFNHRPEPILFNQVASISLWGLALLYLAKERLHFQCTTATLVFAVLSLAPWLSYFLFDLPFSLAFRSSAVILMALAIYVLSAGLALERRLVWFEALCWGLLLAGILSVPVALMQVYVPQFTDGQLLSMTWVPGRAVGNIRQPNLLASLLVLSGIALVYLAQRRRFEFRGAVLLQTAIYGLFIYIVLLSASRTGLLGLLLLTLWGFLDRSLSLSCQTMLRLSPIFLCLAWALGAAFAQSGGQALSVNTRLGEGASSPLRLAMLNDAWLLLKESPWLGVGWGEFNFAWTMSVLPQRSVAHWTHAHNLFVQLLVETGWLIGGALSIGIVRILFLAVRQVKNSADHQVALSRSAIMMILVVFGHSLLEYPLWYPYFLFTTAFVLGVLTEKSEVLPAAEGGPGREILPTLPAAFGLVMVLGGLYAVSSYNDVVEVFEPSADAPVLEKRLAAASGAWLFSSHLDYALATSTGDASGKVEAARRAAHNMLDANLMMGWANSLDQAGDTERAKFVAQRLKEFKKPESKQWFDACKQDENTGIQCVEPVRNFSWRDMK